LVTETAGTYRLNVLAKQKNAPTGRYEIQVVERRDATENDRALDEANKLFKESLTLRRAGKYNDALPLAERLLKIRQRLLGSDHTDVAAAINLLGILYSDNGEYAKAEPLYDRALAILEKTQGPEHPEVAHTLHSLAMLYCNRGEYAKAITFY